MTSDDYQLPMEPARRVPSAEFSSKREALGVLLIFGVLGTVVLIGHAAGITFCLFRRLTVIPCPCCGTTRAFLSVLRGDIVGAVTYNPLAVIVILLGPFALWLMTLRKAWPRSFVVAGKVLAWSAVLLNWAYLLFRELAQR